MPEESSDTKAVWRQLEEHREGLASLREGHGRHEARLNAMEQRVDRAVHTLTLQHGELRSAVDVGFESGNRELREMRDEMIKRRTEDALRNRLMGWVLALATLTVGVLALVLRG